MLVKIDLNRYAEEIGKLTAFPVQQGKLLLYGSSFFGVWGHERAAIQMDGMVVNHGFGGSTAEELLYYYGTLVKPYAPSAMLVRSGINDISSGYTPKQSVKLIQRLCEWTACDFGSIPIGLMAGFRCPWMEADKGRAQLVEEYNQRLEAYAAQQDNLCYLDISPLLMADKHTCREGFFRPDGLHLTDYGYETVAPALKSMLAEQGLLPK